MNVSPGTFTARLLTITWLPEFNLALFALLLNFPWELLQAPLFEGLARMPHWEAVKGCSRAALGDTAILLIAHGSVAASGSGRNWIMAPTRLQMTAFVLVGVSITVAIELLATRGWWYSGWSYSAAMPVLPGLRVGLVPLIQWIVLPPLAVILARRQLRGHSIS
ncbi:MAG: hypothetical protein ABI661_02315 [Gammaproteobacteria bacterium]